MHAPKKLNLTCFGKKQTHHLKHKDMHLGTKIEMSPKKGVEQSLPETEMRKEVELTAGLEFELSLRKGVEPRLTKIENGDDAQIAMI